MKRLFFLLSIWTTLTFLWRFFVPAHEESEGNFLIWLEVVFEITTLVALIGLFFQLRSRDYAGSRAVLAVMFWIALVASIGILVMRFSTTSGWYTGHRVYHPGYGFLQFAPQRDVAHLVDIAET